MLFFQLFESSENSPAPSKDLQSPLRGDTVWVLSAKFPTLETIQSSVIPSRTGNRGFRLNGESHAWRIDTVSGK